jgi:phage terminase large subunit
LGEVESGSQEERNTYRFRERPPAGSKIVELNWRDNSFFPKILNATRLDDLANRPDQYDWVWNGGFRKVVEDGGGRLLLQAAPIGQRTEADCFVPLDPVMQVRAYFDIGGTGARADAVAIWLSVCRAENQRPGLLRGARATLSVHLDWMRSRGWGKAWVILPHEGAAGDKVFATSYESAIREAQFDVLVIPNQGAGAASARIETARRQRTAATRSAGITKRNGTMTGTWGSGQTTIGALTPRTASA